MPIANNILNAAILAPLVFLLSAVSLASVQRGFEWVAMIAKTPQKAGYLKDMRPYIKHLDTIIERIFGGNKFNITTTNVLLMTIAVLLLALLMEGGEKPKTVRVVTKGEKEN